MDDALKYLLNRILSNIPDEWILNAARIGPVGTVGKGPGTNGSAVGILLYTLVFHRVGLAVQIVMGLLLAGLAVWICGEAEQRLRKRDPGEIILDEVVAVPFCFIGMAPLMQQTGNVWLFMLAGFGLFRLLDILKPFGIRKIQELKGGWGVVADDLAAAVLTNCTLWAGAWAILYS